MSWKSKTEEAITKGLEKVSDLVGIDLPKKKQDVFLENIQGFTKFTPDVARIEAKMRWLLFVPDEMKTNHPDHDRLSRHARFVGEAFTSDTFTLWKERSNVDCKYARAIPLRLQYGKEGAFFPSLRLAIRRTVRGELYYVNPLTLIKLDRYRENGVRFVRERVQVLMPRTEIHLKKISLTTEGAEKHVGTTVREEKRLLGEPLNVWMYVGVSEYWEQHLDGGHGYTLVRVFQPNNPELSKFYCFTPEEHER